MTVFQRKTLHQASSLSLSVIFFFESLYLILWSGMIVAPIIGLAASLIFHALFWRSLRRELQRPCLIGAAVLLAAVGMLQLLHLTEPSLVTFLVVLVPVGVFSFYVPKWTAMVGLVYLFVFSLLLFLPLKDTIFSDLGTDIRMNLVMVAFIAYVYVIVLLLVGRRSSGRAVEPSEEVEQRESQLQQTLSNVSYQLRTALGNIKGVMDALESADPIDDEKKGVMREILDSSVTALRDTADSLFISRHAEAPEPQLVEFDFHDHIREYTQKLLRRLNRKCEIRFSFDPAIAHFVEGDIAYIDQAFERIFGDILHDQILRDETIEVNTLQLGSAHADQFIAQVEVSCGDTVIVVPAAPLLSGAEQSGSGYLSNLKIHRSDHGVAASFRMLLKRIDQHTESLAAAEESKPRVADPINIPPVQTSRLAAARVLLVEDNAINRRVMRLTLLNKVASIDYAVNGQEALSMIKVKPYDIVLMDVQMPVMDGLETARRIRKAEEKTGQHLPIIALTAYALRGDRELCLEAGMDAYIAKPFQNETLFAMMSQHLKKSKS